jgi:hypothetical protein
VIEYPAPAGPSTLLFGGIRINICEHLPKTKRITWRTERKWCHRRKFPRQQYRVNSKEVACETMIMMGGQAFVSPETAERLNAQLIQVPAR